VKPATAAEPACLSVVHVIDVVSDVVCRMDSRGGRVQVVMGRTPTVVTDAKRLARVTARLLERALQLDSGQARVEVEIADRCLERGQDSDPDSSICQANVSVAIRARGRSRAGTSIYVEDQRDCLDEGRLWVAARPDEHVLGYCLGTRKAA